MLTLNTLKQFLALLWGKDWVTGTGYLVNDYVIYNGALYRCATAHTAAAAFATDLAAGKWVVVYDKDKDPLLQDCITEAIGRAESETSQNLAYDEYTEILKGNGLSEIYLRCRYVYLVLELKIYNKNGNYEWNDIFDSPHTITDAVLSEDEGLITSVYKLTLKNNYIFPAGSKIRIKYTGGYVSGDSWEPAHSYIEDDYAVYNSRLYSCLTTHTSAVLFATDLAAGKWLLGIEVLAPADIRNAVKYDAAMQYIDSPAGSGLFMKGSINIGGQSTEGSTLKREELQEYISKTYAKYRIQNI